MHSNRVLIVNVRSLLLESVAGLLVSSGDGQLSVVDTQTNDLPDLLREVMEIKPDIIVIDEATCAAKPTDLIACLLNTKKIRLIVLNTEINRMEIFDKSEINLIETNDFIEAVNYTQTSTYKGGDYRE